jgi:hypothetical protein
MHLSANEEEAGAMTVSVILIVFTDKACSVRRINTNDVSNAVYNFRIIFNVRF